MVLRKSKYKDMDKFLKTRNEQRKRYYQKSQGYRYKRWTEKDIEMIVTSEMTDHELSELLCRSVQAIQTMRCKVKKEGLHDQARVQRNSKEISQSYGMVQQ